MLPYGTARRRDAMIVTNHFVECRGRSMIRHWPMRTRSLACIRLSGHVAASGLSADAEIGMRWPGRRSPADAYQAARLASSVLPD